MYNTTKGRKKKTKQPNSCNEKKNSKSSATLNENVKKFAYAIRTTKMHDFFCALN